GLHSEMNSHEEKEKSIEYTEAKSGDENINLYGLFTWSIPAQHIKRRVFLPYFRPHHSENRLVRFGLQNWRKKKRFPIKKLE
ncbi:hypothetical protein PENTCL1PPCAC_217, partial [Pristionchus entomophagus]